MSKERSAAAEAAKKVVEELTSLEEKLKKEVVVDIKALVGSINLYPEEKERKFSFLFPKEKQDAKKKQLQQEIENKAKEKKQFIEEKQEIFKKLQAELNDINKQIAGNETEIKDIDARSEPPNNHGQAYECTWKLSPRDRPHNEENQACKRQIAEKRTNIEALENNKTAKETEIKQEKDLAFEQISTLTIEQLKLEQLGRAYDNLNLEEEEDGGQEEVVLPDYVKYDEYYSGY